jgi:hypothetical protein
MGGRFKSSDATMGNCLSLGGALAPQFEYRILTACHHSPTYSDSRFSGGSRFITVRASVPEPCEHR